MLGIIDFEIATRCHGLLEIGMLSQASSMTSEYLAWRSHTKQLRSRCLNVALAELNFATAQTSKRDNGGAIENTKSAMS